MFFYSLPWRINISKTSALSSWISFNTFWSFIKSSWHWWHLSNWLLWFILFPLCLLSTILSHMYVIWLDLFIKIMWIHLLNFKHFWRIFEYFSIFTFIAILGNLRTICFCAVHWHAMNVWRNTEFIWATFNYASWSISIRSLTS